MSSYRGFYINMAANTRRRQAIEQQLEQLGLADRYQRIEAVVGRDVAPQYTSALEPGALGLWLSHVRFVEAARATEGHLHLIEDDTLFALQVGDQFDRILAHADQHASDWDLIYTDIHLSTLDVSLFRSMIDVIQMGGGLHDLCRAKFAGTSSFFLNRRSLDKYAKLLEVGLAENVPIDLYLRNLAWQGKLKCLVTVPFQTTVSREALTSDIRGPLDKSRAVATLYRMSLFRDADLPALMAEIQSLTADATHGPREAIYLRALTYTLSQQWTKF